MTAHAETENEQDSISETAYLLAIPGMRESIVEGMAESLDQGFSELDW